MMESKFYTASDVASIYGVSVSWVKLVARTHNLGWKPHKLLRLLSWDDVTKFGSLRASKRGPYRKHGIRRPDPTAQRATRGPVDKEGDPT